MTSAGQVKQARKMNWAMIQANKEGKTATAALARKYRIMNMQAAGQLWIQGK